MESDLSPQIKGVVIITLPPPDNPSLGKTITTFTLTDDGHPLPHPEQPHQIHTLEGNHPPIQFPPPQRPSSNPLLQFSLSRLLLDNPRGLLAFVSVSLFALFLYSTVFTRSIQELKDSKDGQDPQSFIFPLYHKLGIYEMPQSELQQNLRFVVKESLVVPTGDVIERSDKVKLTSSKAAALDSSTILPVRGNVFPDGLYFTYLLVGNPPRPYYLDIDTGSDLTWIQCDAPCASCAKGANALYKPRRGNIVPPKDSFCTEVQRNHKAGDCETCQQCDYEIEYADHSSSMGVLARDEQHLTSTNGSLTKFKAVFGCAYDQQGPLLNTLAKTDGILGLSRAKVSLPSQLASQGIVKNVIGHCLSTDINGGGYMFFGDEFIPKGGMAWVPMLDKNSVEFYHTEIVKLNYGRTPLSLGSRMGKIVFDSGSSYTYFPKETYTQLIASVEQVSEAGLYQDTSDETLPICWRGGFPIRSITEVKRFFKTLTLQFGSKWWIVSTKFRIPPEGYLVISKKGNVCLGILDGSKVHDGSTIILGDVSLRGQLVVFDNINKRIGWEQSDCTKPRRFNSPPLPFFED
ncbi:hypothetical protein K2173_007070 [Erythroxylum novogranatense]|uniref:Peptidase A1 domain-containing protein n=1 Tax=Erythroxylum novogranatense TaxID=1862640 RepID=A0AAV8SLI3_9ROSI|nr:hypothetical protein K2173_007070 [Erythroxylum novogranatense]